MTLPLDEEISLASEERRSRWMRRRLQVFCLALIVAAGVELAVSVIALLWRGGSFLHNLAARSAGDLLPGVVAILVFLFVQGSFAHRIYEVFILPTAGIPGLLYCCASSQ